MTTPTSCIRLLLICSVVLSGAACHGQRSADAHLLLPAERLAALRSVADAPADTSLAAQLYRVVRARATEKLDAAPLEREMDGRRLLKVSREAVRRLADAALVYRVSGEPAYRRSAERDLRAVTAFSDWNPPHFLDVAEMSLAVALAIDWLGDDLSPGLRDSARVALYTKALLPSLDTARAINWWVDADNNWNQVGHTGMIAAALVLRDEYPTLADTILRRAVREMPVALAVYAPDGAYPEGVGYWAYGTSYSVIGLELLRSGLGDDYGLAALSGFRESARYVGAMRAPSGRIYNYGDSSGDVGPVGEAAMLWFARELGEFALVHSERVLAEAAEGSRFSAFGLTWMPEALFDAAGPAAGGHPDSVYVGQGLNAVAAVRQPAASPGYYLGVKGGRASINHGQMDAGSFVLEVDSVRWAIDLGNQSYGPLEAAGFQLWGRDQEAQRWQLLSKNNRGHSTVSLAGRPHRVDSVARLRQDAATGAVSVDMGGVLGAGAAFWHRRFDPTPQGLVTVDSFRLAPGETGVYQWLTTADVTGVDDRTLRLSVGGAGGLSPKRLTLRLTEPGQRFDVVSLAEPPHPLDIRMPNLKRIEVRVPGTGEVQRIEVAAATTPP